MGWIATWPTFARLRTAGAASSPGMDEMRAAAKKLLYDCLYNSPGMKSVLPWRGERGKAVRAHHGRSHASAGGSHQEDRSGRPREDGDGLHCRHLTHVHLSRCGRGRAGNRRIREVHAHADALFKAAGRILTAHPVVAGSISAESRSLAVRESGVSCNRQCRGHCFVRIAVIDASRRVYCTRARGCSPRMFVSAQSTAFLRPQTQVFPMPCRYQKRADCDRVSSFLQSPA